MNRVLDKEDIESLDFNHIERCEDPKNSESTYQKVISKDEIYCLVFHYNINQITISIHDDDIANNYNIKRLFQGIIESKSELEILLKKLEDIL